MRERAREREAELSPFRIWFAEVAPLSARGVLLGQSIQYHLAGWVLRGALDRINTDLALLTGAVTKPGSCCITGGKLHSAPHARPRPLDRHGSRRSGAALP
ncbi:MAG: hypothetical protein WA633_10185 [Stellaceae bacterium]